MYIWVHICVCVTNAFPNLYLLLVLIIVNFHHACYGEYLTIANFNAVQEKIIQHLNYHLVLNNEYKLFGISKHNVPQLFVQRVNHVILIAKLCISKYVNGEYDNIVKLLEHKLTLRKIFQEDE